MKNCSPIEDLVAAAQAASDPGRLRLLAALRREERCVCQLIDLLGLAPATVSRHLRVLHDAGLVQRHKRGRWAYYRLPGRDASPAVRRTLRWVCEGLDGDPTIDADARRLQAQARVDLATLTACYAP